jgi:hypothetical protein
MDWMAWPPSPPTAPTATGITNSPQNGNNGQTQRLHTHNREPQLHQAASAALTPLDLDSAPSVNHWLPGSLPEPLAGCEISAAAGGASAAAGAGAARPGSASGAPRGATSPLLQGQDQLQLHQIHIGGEPLFHTAMVAAHSLPYNTCPGAGGETQCTDTAVGSGDTDTVTLVGDAWQLEVQIRIVNNCTSQRQADLLEQHPRRLLSQHQRAAGPHVDVAASTHQQA